MFAEANRQICKLQMGVSVVKDFWDYPRFIYQTMVTHYVLLCCYLDLDVIFFSLLSTCFAAAAELMNGTQIAIKDCYGWQENCSLITACEQGANMTDATFKRCYATCCTTMHCNDMLHVLESTTLFINYSTPQAKSSSTHENRSTEKSTAPTSSSAVYKHISHLLVLLSVLPIASYSIR